MFNFFKKKEQEKDGKKLAIIIAEDMSTYMVDKHFNKGKEACLTAIVSMMISWFSTAGMKHDAFCELMDMMKDRYKKIHNED